VVVVSGDEAAGKRPSSSSAAGSVAAATAKKITPWKQQNAFQKLVADRAQKSRQLKKRKRAEDE
jgi:hypothetical protein